jgi:hypothetical protein
MATTTERGYGWQHQRLRAALLAELIPGSPCPRCHQPMWPGAQDLDLGHIEGSGKTMYEGITHASCNRRSGARYGNRLRGRDSSVTRRRRRWRPPWPPPEEPPSPRSRRW